MGKILIIIGIILVIAGFTIHFGIKLPFGRLPGDFHFKRDNFSFYFPFTTTIIISLLLTIIVYIIQKLK